MRREDFFEVIGDLDDDIVEESDAPVKKRFNWRLCGAVAASLCIVICALAVSLFGGSSGNPVSADLAPMVYVNDTVYQILGSQPDLTGKESQFVYLGEILSSVSSSQYPEENFQANDDIVGSIVYQYGKDIVVEINGQYQLYAMLDVDYTVNDDGTYTCRGGNYRYKIEVSGIDGESQVTFIILTNDTETSFDEVSYSLKKAEMTTGTPEFIILGWYY